MRDSNLPNQSEGESGLENIFWEGKKRKRNSSSGPKDSRWVVKRGSEANGERSSNSYSCPKSPLYKKNLSLDFSFLLLTILSLQKLLALENLNHALHYPSNSFSSCPFLCPTSGSRGCFRQEIQLGRPSRHLARWSKWWVKVSRCIWIESRLRTWESPRIRSILEPSTQWLLNTNLSFSRHNSLWFLVFI